MWKKWRGSPEYAKKFIVRQINDRTRYSEKYGLTFEEADDVICERITPIKQIVLKLEANGFTDEPVRLRKLIDKEEALAEYQEER